MCHSKSYFKISKTSILFQVYRSGHTGSEIGHFLCQSISMNLLIHDTEKKIDDIFEIQFACKLSKLVSGSKPGYAPLNAENSVSITLGIIAAYAHETINIIISVLNIIFFIFYDLIWIRKILFNWSLLSINWAFEETCQFSQNAMYEYLLYSCFISYKHVQTVFLYQNKLYIFPIARLALFILEPAIIKFQIYWIQKGDSV